MKLKFNSIACFFILISCIAVSSCKKEKENSSQNAIPANDLKLATMLDNFKARGNSHLKSTALMSVDSAIWYIGATANYTYGTASRETERTWTDSCFITLPVNNGKITESDVFNKYEAVIDSLRSIYQTKNEENKQLLAVSVTTHSVNATSLICKVTGVFAYGILPNNRPCTFNDIDSYCFWYIWQYQSICAGPNVNSTWITDAAEESQKRIMWCKSVPAGNYWYDPIIKTVEFDDPSIYPVIPGNINKSNDRYAYLYWNSSQYNNPSIEGCIPPADLNFYLIKTKELINREDTPDQSDLPGLRPPGYSLMDIDLIGTKVTEDGYQIYKHKAIILYGVLHVNNDPPDELD